MSVWIKKIKTYMDPGEVFMLENFNLSPYIHPQQVAEKTVVLESSKINILYPGVRL